MVTAMKQWDLLHTLAAVPSSATLMKVEMAWVVRSLASCAKRVR